MGTATPLKLGHHRSRASQCLQSVLALASQLNSSKALYACLSAAIVTSGVRGLNESPSSRTWLELCVNAHTFFAVSLCAILFVRYRSSMQHSGGALPIDGRALSRQLSRIVYFFLYAVIAVTQGIAIINSVLHGVPLDFNIMDERFRGPDSGAFAPLDDFQLFVATCLFALLFARALAFRIWQRKETSFKSDGCS